MNDLERHVWHHARVKLKNPKLKKKEVIEWTSGKAKPRPEETMIKVRCLDVTWEVCVLKEHDLRTDEEKMKGND
jgi:hypothetical protein